MGLKHRNTGFSDSPRYLSSGFKIAKPVKVGVGKAELELRRVENFGHKIHQ